MQKRTGAMRRARSALMAMAFGSDSMYYCGRTWCRLDGAGGVNENGGMRVVESVLEYAGGEQGGCH